MQIGIVASPAGGASRVAPLLNTRAQLSTTNHANNSCQAKKPGLLSAPD